MWHSCHSATATEGRVLWYTYHCSSRVKSFTIAILALKAQV